jgi:hypothetical protein
MLKWIINILFLLGISLLNAQENSFRAGFNFGLVGSQIDGDGAVGFHKGGLVLGGLVNYPISQKASFQFEINYLNKGSKKLPTKNDPSFFAIRLNYIEVPLFLKIEHNSIIYQFGMSYGRLINQRFFDEYGEYTPVQSGLFKRQEFAFHLGAGYRISSQATVHARYTRSIIPVRDFSLYVPTLGFIGGSYNTAIVISINYFLKNAEKN